MRIPTRALSTCSYEVVFLTWKKIIDLYRAKKINLHPAYQRGEAAPAMWRSYFVGGVFQRTLPTVIAFRKMEDGTYQVIDGLQRLLAMLRFFAGELRTPAIDINGAPFVIERGGVMHRIGGKTFREISATLEGKSLIAELQDTQVLVVMYSQQMTDEQASLVFITLNNNTDLNPAEITNGYLGCVTALFRLLARGIGMDGTTDLSKRLKLLGIIQMKEGRLVFDDFVSRCILLELWHSDPNAKEGIYFGLCDTKNVRLMATGSLTTEAKAPLLKKLEKEVRRRCDVVMSWIKDSGTSKKPLHTKTLADVVTLYQLTYALEDKFGKNYKVDATFAPNLFVALTYLNNRKAYAATARFADEKTPFESIKTSLRPELVSKKMHMILDKIGNKGITMLDSKRVFERGEVYIKWIEQEKKCAATGLPLNFLDAVGGHRNAHGLGYRTEADTNLVVIDKTINAKMGTKSFDDYVKQLSNAPKA